LSCGASGSARRSSRQPQALRLFETHADAAGLRWWSTYEAAWGNATLFDRAAQSLRVEELRELTLDDPDVTVAADFFAFQKSR
jgi:hypothetical protein